MAWHEPIRRWYAGLTPAWRRELRIAGLWLGFGLLVMPFLIYLAGVLTLGPYDGGLPSFLGSLLAASFGLTGALGAEEIPGLVKERPASGRFVETDQGFMVPYTATIPGTEVTFEMVPIPGGKFKLGSPPDEEGRKPEEGPQIGPRGDDCDLGDEGDARESGDAARSIEVKHEEPGALAPGERPFGRSDHGGRVPALHDDATDQRDRSLCPRPVDGVLRWK